MMTRDKAIKMYTNLKQMRGHVVAADRLVMQLMRHPEATANQIMEMHESCVRVHQQYNDVWNSVNTHCSRALPYGYNIGLLRI